LLEGVASAESVSGHPTVAAAPCLDYDSVGVRAALRQVLEPLGGMGAFVRPGERIALKPNLLLAAAPEAAITTHPALVEAVALEVRAAGAIPFLLESSGAGLLFTAAGLRRTYRKTGMQEMADRIGLELNVDTTAQTISSPGAVVAKRLDLVAALACTDGLISLPKLKTHYFMTFTGAVKNLFGLVPGFTKTGYHAKLPDAAHFADMLLDVLEVVVPRLSIMDAVIGLEGDGPGTSGQPRHIGALLAGADAVALDAACCRLTGIDPTTVPTLVAARRRGLWSGDPAEVRLTGMEWADLRVEGFKAPRRPSDGSGLGPFLPARALTVPLVRDLLNPRPRPQEGRCTRCRTCERACPQHAITVGDGPATVDDSLCIRCYCCHELCPEAAIELCFLGWGRLAHALRIV
jgi:uncharacterized protein (DUF362 family)/Pyruvate/2-oxoacid:ferredoxin oxidoreductase delta subunit